MSRYQTPQPTGYTNTSHSFVPYTTAQPNLRAEDNDYLTDSSPMSNTLGLIPGSVYNETPYDSLSQGLAPLGSVNMLSSNFPHSPVTPGGALMHSLTPTPVRRTGNPAPRPRHYRHVSTSETSSHHEAIATLTREKDILQAKYDGLKDAYNTLLLARSTPTLPAVAPTSVPDPPIAVSSQSHTQVPAHDVEFRRLVWWDKPDDNVVQEAVDQAEFGNTSLIFVRNRIGQAIDAKAARRVKKSIRGLFSKMPPEEVKPTWGEVDDEAKVKLFIAAEKICEFLAYCDLHWKAEAICEKQYSYWYHRHSAQKLVKQEAQDDIDEASPVDPSIPEVAPRIVPPVSEPVKAVATSSKKNGCKRASNVLDEDNLIARVKRPVPVAGLSNRQPSSSPDVQLLDDFPSSRPPPSDIFAACSSGSTNVQHSARSAGPLFVRASDHSYVAPANNPVTNTTVHTSTTGSASSLCASGVRNRVEVHDSPIAGDSSIGSPTPAPSPDDTMIPSPLDFTMSLPGEVNSEVQSNITQTQPSRVPDKIQHSAPAPPGPVSATHLPPGSDDELRNDTPTISSLRLKPPFAGPPDLSATDHDDIDLSGDGYGKILSTPDPTASAKMPARLQYKRKSVIAQAFGPPPPTTTISRDDAVEAAQVASAAKASSSAPKTRSATKVSKPRVTAKTAGVKSAYELWQADYPWDGDKKSRQAYWRKLPAEEKKKYQEMEKAAIEAKMTQAGAGADADVDADTDMDADAD